MLIAVALVAAAAGCSGVNVAARWGSSHPPPRSSRAPDAYLRGVGGRLVDFAGRRVRLVGVSWFGFETPTCAPHGLSARNWRSMLLQMRRVGFNVVRLPFSTRLLDDPMCVPRGIDYALNPDLAGLQGLALLDAIVNGAGKVGLRVILDRHAPDQQQAGDLWYTEAVPQSQWISDWVMLARHYLGNQAVVGADLSNEPHGAATWGDGNAATDWRLAAQQAGNAVLAANPNLLILVEGIQYYHGDQYWWGGQLLGAATYPVRLSHPDKLVYSPHDYGPSLSPQAWFRAPDFPQNLPGVWDRHWGDLVRLGTPVLVGEYGGSARSDVTEDGWQRSLIAYLAARGIGSIYWSWNADSSDSDGILEADWQTINQRELDLVLGRQLPTAPLST